MLRLAQTTLLAILQPWSVVEPVYQRLVQLSDDAVGAETLWIGCGSGRSVLWWAQKRGTLVQGLDPDAKAIESAEKAVRGSDLARLVTFQVADPSSLPHEDQMFDAVIVQMLYLRGASGDLVLSEAARVARAMGTVIALVPSWLRTPLARDAATLRSMGVSPRLPVEWKGYLRDAGIVELSAEEAVAGGKWLVSGFFTLVVRGWRAAGWAGLRAVLSREVRILRRLARRRVLGISIVKGTRWPHG